jgi:hypothetical protein
MDLQIQLIGFFIFSGNLYKNKPFSAENRLYHIHIYLHGYLYVLTAPALLKEHQKGEFQYKGYNRRTKKDRDKKP